MAERVGLNIRAARLRKGLSQPQLAARIGVESFQVSRWEMGRHRPSDETLFALAEALDLQLSDLFVEPDEAAA